VLTVEGLACPQTQATVRKGRKEEVLQLSSEELLVFHGELLQHPVKVLIDCAASRNFVSSSWVHQHKLQPSCQETDIRVKTADGRAFSMNEYFRDAKLQIANYSDKVNLKIFPLENYDLILGMEWLKKVNPMIDYQTCLVKFKHNRCEIQLKSEITPTEVNSLEDKHIDHMFLNAKDSLRTSYPEMKLISAKRLLKDYKQGCELNVMFVKVSTEETAVRTVYDELLYEAKLCKGRYDEI